MGHSAVWHLDTILECTKVMMLQKKKSIRLKISMCVTKLSIDILFIYFYNQLKILLPVLSEFMRIN